MTRALAVALAALLTQGCAVIPVAAAVTVMGAVPEGGGDPVAEEVPSAPPASQAASAGLPILGSLPPQDLAAGDCALFLFTRGAEPRFAAFAPADGGALSVSLDGAIVVLAAAAPLADSENAFAQTYRGDAGLEARLTASLGDPLPQGRVAPEASLRLAAADGTTQVTPLSGLLACEPES